MLLKRELASVDTSSGFPLRWWQRSAEAGRTNGDLMEAADHAGFDVMVTADQTSATSRTWRAGNWRLSRSASTIGRPPGPPQIGCSRQ
jgi:hypothetical protein